MYNKKFELFMGCLGNGVTVCNKAVEEYGDYKKIAHIADCGRITWYVETISIPGDALLKIEHESNTRRENFKRFLESMPAPKRYGYLLDNAPHAAFMHAIDMETGIEEKIDYLLNVLYQKSTF